MAATPIVITAGTTSVAAFATSEEIYVLEGGQTVTGTVDQSAQTQAVLGEFAPAFTGQFGTAAAPFQQSFSGRLVYAAGAGDLYWASNASDSDTTALVQVLGGGHLHFMAGGTGIATRFEQLRGTTTVASGAVVTTARCAGGVMNLLDAGGATAVTTLDVMGGSVYMQKPATTINVLSGNLVIDSDDASAVNAYTTINVYGGQVTLLDPGTITNFNWYGGVVTPPNARKVTLTNSLVNMALPNALQFTQHPLITHSALVEIITDGRPV